MALFDTLRELGHDPGSRWTADDTRAKRALNRAWYLERTLMDETFAAADRSHHDYARSLRESSSADPDDERFDTFAETALKQDYANRHRR